MSEPKAALIFPTMGLDVAMTRSGLQLAWSLGPSAQSFITDGLKRIYKEAPAYDDLVNFPYKLEVEDLVADVWFTGNALPCIQALKLVRAIGALPGYVIAHLPSLDAAPSLVRAWRETHLFAQIEWSSEPCWKYGCHIDRLQYYLCGTLKSARDIGLSGADKSPKAPFMMDDLIRWGSSGSWTGPIDLDPKGDDGHPISIINLFRNGAASGIVASLTRCLTKGSGLRDYNPDHAFAKFRLDEKLDEREVVAKLTDGGIQRLLDGSLENFYDVWPSDGCCMDDGLLIRRERTHAPMTKPLEPFERVRNVRYIAATLGLPDCWLPG